MKQRKILVTGGLGFIGSNFVKYWLDTHPEDHIMVLDADTYAAQGYLKGTDLSRMWTLKGDIRNRESIRHLLKSFKPDHIFHLAAESHVCRSISGPEDFITTNIQGTFNLLEEWRQHQDENKLYGLGCRRFIHVSTDEVFGDLGLRNPMDYFYEGRAYQPTSPYAASKAASDHLAKVYHQTYGLDVVVTNCSNNFGPNQHDEKLIPRTIRSMVKGEDVIVHGRGDHVRDWIHVLDHCRALESVFKNGLPGESYCVGGTNWRSNLTVILDIEINLRFMLGGKIRGKLKHTEDRPTDDERYAVDTTKLRSLGWEASKNYHESLRETIQWYLDNRCYAEEAK